MNNIFTRSLFVLFAVFFILISSLTMIIAFKTDAIADIYYFLENSIEGNYYSTPVIITIITMAIIFLVTSIIFLGLGLKIKKDRKFVSKHTELGDVKISFITVENVVMNTAGKFNEIRNVNAVISKTYDDINVIIKAQVLPDVCIPALSEQLQGEIKRSVEESTGIVVKEVKVYVQRIYSESLAKKNNNNNKMIKVDSAAKTNQLSSH